MDNSLQPCHCVFERNQISVPPSVREALDLLDGTVLACQVLDGSLWLTKVPDLSIRAQQEGTRPEPAQGVPTRPGSLACPAAEADSPALIRVECFGRFNVTNGGSRVCFRSAKARELLALLVAERGRPISKRRAASALWPGSGERQAKESLYKAIRALKRMEGVSVPLPVLDERGSLALDMTGISADTEDFLHLHAEDSERSRRLACELYRSGLFADEDFDWVLEYDGTYEMRFQEMLCDLP